MKQWINKQATPFWRFDLNQLTARQALQQFKNAGEISNMAHNRRRKHLSNAINKTQQRFVKTTQNLIPHILYLAIMRIYWLRVRLHLFQRSRPQEHNISSLNHAGFVSHPSLLAKQQMLNAYSWFDLL